jgi:hypothetical protein
MTLKNKRAFFYRNLLDIIYCSKGCVKQPFYLITFLFLVVTYQVFFHQKFMTFALMEDGIYEYLTAGFFLLASFGFIVKFKECRNFLYLGYFIGCLFVAGEEISWGQRLLQIIPYDYFLEQNYQQEINFHNSFNNEFVSGGLSLYILLGMQLILLPVVNYKIYKDKFSFKLCIFYFLLLLTLIGRPFQLVDELVEMLLGFLLFVESLHYLKRTTFQKYLSVSSTLVVLLIYFVQLESSGAPEKSPIVINELKSIVNNFEISTNINKWYKLKNRPFDDRIYSSLTTNKIRVNDETIKIGNLKRKKYFIDPWGSSYFILYMPKYSGGIIYSLGPNGKRDTLFHQKTIEELKMNNIEGDDISRWFNNLD